MLAESDIRLLERVSTHYEPTSSLKWLGASPKSSSLLFESREPAYAKWDTKATDRGPLTSHPLGILKGHWEHQTHVTAPGPEEGQRVNNGCLSEASRKAEGRLSTKAPRKLVQCRREGRAWAHEAEILYATRTEMNQPFLRASSVTRRHKGTDTRAQQNAHISVIPPPNSNPCAPNALNLA